MLCVHRGVWPPPLPTGWWLLTPDLHLEVLPAPLTFLPKPAPPLLHPHEYRPVVPVRKVKVLFHASSYTELVSKTDQFCLILRWSPFLPGPLLHPQKAPIICYLDEIKLSMQTVEQVPNTLQTVKCQSSEKLLLEAVWHIIKIVICNPSAQIY